MGSNKIVLAILLAAMAFNSTPGLASTFPVLVQCSIQGPVYAGTVEYDDNIGNWKFERCSEGSTGNYLISMFRLSFNGLSYEGNGGYATSAEYSGDNCSGTIYKEIVGGGGKSLINQETGFGAFSSARFSKEGKFVSMFIQNTADYCAVRVK